MRLLSSEEMDCVSGAGTGPGTVVSTVVVTAHQYDGPFLDLGGGYRAYGTAAGGASTPGVGPGDHALLFMNVDPNSQPSVEQVKADGLIVAHMMAEMDAKIATLSDTATYQLPGSQTFNGSRFETGAEIKADWAKTDFSVTDQTAFGNGGIGTAVYGNGGRNAVTLSTQAVEQYGAYANGDAFLLLHELSHVTDAGNQFNLDANKYYRLELQSGWVSGSFANSDQWNNNEAYADDSANMLAGALGYDTSGIYQAFAGVGLTNARTPYAIWGQARLDHHG